MDEPTKRLWDVRISAIAPILTVLGLLLGIYQFRQGAINQTRLEYELLDRKDRIEFQRKLWLERLETYQSISKLAGQIAAHGESDAVMKKLVNDFLSAYYGMMVLVEDAEVAKQMTAFREDLQNFHDGFLDAQRLRKGAIALSDACRKSVQKGTIEAEKGELK